MPNEDEPSRSPPYLFLSHSGADTAEAKKLHDMLLAHPDAIKAGLRIWFDQNADALPPGGNWQELIGNAIDRETTAFAVYVGSRGIINWVERETNLAVSRATGKSGYLLIPILARGVEGSSALPPFVRQHQGVKDPLGDAEAFKRLLGTILGQRVEAPPVLTDTPFVGLRSMTEKEADRFFGRDREIDEVLERMRSFRLVAISAESGSGKSSLAQAGVIPHYRGGALEPEGRAAPVTRIRHVVVMRPTNDPVEGLRLAITKAAEELGLDGEKQAGLRRRVDLANVSETAYAIRCDLPAGTTETLLVVDQLEELRTSPPKVQQDFLTLLRGLAAMPGDSGFRVLLTVREDYLDLFLGADLLGPTLTGDNKDARYNLERISDDPGLVEAIVKPLRMAGRTNQGELDTLVRKFQEDTRQRPGDLALVQMALFVIWRRRGEADGQLDRVYDKVGGVSGALADEAERVRGKALKEPEQSILLSIFIRLVRLGSTGGATRRTARISEFDQPRRDLIDKLTGDEHGRLLMIDGDTVEIAHEALITRWAWLNEQLNAPDAPRDARRLERLMDRAETWSGKWWKTAELATGAELDSYVQLRNARRDWLSVQEERFVASGQRARLLTAGAAVAVVFVLLTIAALNYWNAVAATRQAEVNAVAAETAATKAKQSADEASHNAERLAQASKVASTTATLGSARVSASDGDRLAAISSAVEVLQSNVDASLSDEAVPVLYNALSSRLPKHMLNGQMIGYADGLVRFATYDGAPRTRIFQYDPATDTVSAIAEQDGTYGNCTFAACSDDHDVFVLDENALKPLPSGKLALATSPTSANFVFADGATRADMLAGLRETAGLYSGEVGDIPASLGEFSTDPEWDPINAEWAPRGDYFGIMSQSRAVVLRKGATSGVELSLPDGYSPLFMRFSQDVATVATASTDYPEVSLWNTRTGQLLTTLKSGTREARDVAFNAAGDRIVTGSQNGSVRLFSVPGGQLEFVLATRTEAVADVDFDVTGGRICALWTDGTAMVWDSVTLSVVDGPLKAHRDTAEHIVCQGSYMYLSGSWGTEVWDMSDTIEAPVLSVTPLPNPGTNYGLHFTEAGRAMIIVYNDDGCSSVWVGGTGKASCELASDSVVPDQHFYPEMNIPEDGASLQPNKLCVPFADDPSATPLAACVDALPVNHNDPLSRAWCAATPTDVMPDCTERSTRREIAMRVQQSGDSPAQVAAVITSQNRVVLFDGTGVPLGTVELPHSGPIPDVFSVRYDRVAHMLFVFQGYDYAEMWDGASGRLLVNIATDSTFLGSRNSVAEVDTAHRVLAAYRDLRLYEYRYFTSPDEMLALASETLARLGAR